MSYKKRTLDLTNVVLPDNAIELAPIGRRVVEVFVTKVPTGVVFQLLFGQNSDPIDIDGPVSFQPTEDNGNNGLFWANPTALPGTTVDVYVVYGAGLSERRDAR